MVNVPDWRLTHPKGIMSESAEGATEQSGHSGQHLNSAIGIDMVVILKDLRAGQMYLLVPTHTCTSKMHKHAGKRSSNACIHKRVCILPSCVQVVLSSNILHN
jgi:hypothetical protein